MPDTIKFNNTTVKLQKGDITDLDIEAFVYYARNDLDLGSGFGNAITMRGGIAIKKELEKIGGIEDNQAVISSAGELKAKYIVHAVGPKFQEDNLEIKLQTTILNTLSAADKKGIKQLAFPPMGVGFYGVPLATSAKVMFATIKEYLKSSNKNLEEIIISLLSNRDYKPFEAELSSLN